MVESECGVFSEISPEGLYIWHVGLACGECRQGRQGGFDPVRCCVRSKGPHDAIPNGLVVVLGWAGVQPQIRRGEGASGGTNRYRRHGDSHT